jgi:hypothetical protein
VPDDHRTVNAEALDELVHPVPPRRRDRGRPGALALRGQVDGDAVDAVTEPLDDRPPAPATEREAAEENDRGAGAVALVREGRFAVRYAVT